MARIGDSLLNNLDVEVAYIGPFNTQDDTLEYIADVFAPRTSKQMGGIGFGMVSIISEDLLKPGRIKLTPEQDANLNPELN